MIIGLQIWERRISPLFRLKKIPGSGHQLENAKIFELRTLVRFKNEEDLLTGISLNLLTAESPKGLLQSVSNMISLNAEKINLLNHDQFIRACG